MPRPDTAMLAALDAISTHFPTVTALTLEDDDSNLTVYAIEQNPVPNLDNPDDPDYPYSEADINALIDHHLASLQLRDLGAVAADLRRQGHQLVINDTTAWIGLRTPPLADPDPVTPTPVHTPLQAAVARLKAANTELLAAYADVHVQELAELARQIRRDHPEAHSVGLIRWWSELDDYGGNWVTTDQVFDHHGAEIEGRSDTGWYVPLAGSRFEASTAHITDTHPLLADAVKGSDQNRVIRLEFDHILAVASSAASTPNHPTRITQEWESVPVPHPDARPTPEPGPPSPGISL